jgi:hypothetical protein
VEDRADRRRRARAAEGALGALAAAVTAATALAFAAATSATLGRRLEAFDELVFVAVGVAFLRGGSDSRRIAAVGGLGLLALTVGMLRFAALTHGVVLAAAPADIARALVALTSWAGAVACVRAGTVGVRALAAPQPSPRSAFGRSSGRSARHRSAG